MGKPISVNHPFLVGVWWTHSAVLQPSTTRSMVRPVIDPELIDNHDATPMEVLLPVPTPVIDPTFFSWPCKRRVLEASLTG